MSILDPDHMHGKTATVSEVSLLDERLRMTKKRRKAVRERLAMTLICAPVVLGAISIALAVAFPDRAGKLSKIASTLLEYSTMVSPALLKFYFRSRK